MVATIRKADRAPLDYYPTPAWMTQQLLKHHPIAGTALECCAGDGAISQVLAGFGVQTITADINDSLIADYWMDSTKEESWVMLPTVDWVITNPPYSEADRIVPLAYEHAAIGVAMLLRCTWLESVVTGSKAQWLSEHPPTQIISLPRFAFSKSPTTGKWGTDSAPTWWLIWRKDGYKPQCPIVTVPHSQIEGFHRKPLEISA